MGNHWGVIVVLAGGVALTGCGDDAGTGGMGGGAGASGSAGSSAGGGGAAPCSLAPTWQVVDEYEHSPGETTNISSIAADSLGRVYAVGLGKQGGVFEGIVRKSEDGGATWTNLDWGPGNPNDAAADDSGNVYVIGNLDGSNRVIRKTSDGGATWDDVDLFPFGTTVPNDPCGSGAVATGPGLVVVTGASCDSIGWTIRRSNDGGSTWQTVHTFQLAAGKNARLQDVAVDAAGATYASGRALDASDSLFWLTLRGEDQSFMVVDQFQLADGQAAEALGLGGTSQVLAVGVASDGSETRGLVRRAGAPSWATVDQFPTRATSLVEVKDHLIVAGVLETGATTRVVTRRSDDGGATWYEIDQYLHGSSSTSLAGPMAADSDGNVYAAVAAQQAPTMNRWLVRKLACQ